MEMSEKVVTFHMYEHLWRAKKQNTKKHLIFMHQPLPSVK